jgi:hypothetical protein
MPLPELCCVKLTSDAYAADGARLGMIGVVLEIYAGGEAYEVEFCDPEGITLALLAVRAEHLERVPD